MAHEEIVKGVSNVVQEALKNVSSDTPPRASSTYSASSRREPSTTNRELIVTAHAHNFAFCVRNTSRVSQDVTIQ